MARPQVSEQFGNAQLQTQARPTAQTVVAAQPDTSGWKGLASAFASGELILEAQKNMQQQTDRERAAAYANSMTVSELGKRIKAGDMLTSESPVFAATVQHVWGQNTHDAMEREVLSKVTTGELKFTKPEEIDAYLTESRNTSLSGASEYAVAGFDKGYAALRGKLMDSVAKVNDKEIVENASNQASDFLANTLLKVTAKDFKGTPQEAATALLDQYHLMRHTKVMPDAAARSALQEVTQRAAAGGQKGVLEALLNSELPDVGSVRAFLGETKAQTFLATANAQFDKAQRQRVDDEVLPHMLASDTGSLNVEKFMGWAQDPANKDHLSAATVHSILNRNMGALAHQQSQLDRANLRGQAEASVREAQSRVDAALTDGTLWRVQGTSNPKVLTDTGAVSEFNVKDYAEQSLVRRTEGLPFEQQVSTWAMNGLKNPNWENLLKAGLLNLSSIGVGTNGKPTGELNDSGKQAIELFKKLDAVNPDSAKETAGDTAYKRFSDIAFLTQLGRSPSDAASIAANVASGAIVGSDTDKLVKKVHSSVDAILARPWYQIGAVQEYILGDNTTANTSQVTGTLRRYATLLAHSGQYGDADSAVKAAEAYISNPAVSTKINGTLYMRSELPSPPQGGTQEEWFEKFIDKAVKPQSGPFDARQVRLEYDPVMKAYRGLVGGLPMTSKEGGPLIVTKPQIQEWYATQRQLDIVAGAAKAGFASHKRRLYSEMVQLQAKDPYVMERYDGSANKQILDSHIWGKDAYSRLLKDGNQDKPLADLMRIYPANKPLQNK